MATSSYCYRLVGKYETELQRIKEALNKNRGDMDLENADIETDFDDVVKKMTDYCDSLKSTISSYSFE